MDIPSRTWTGGSPVRQTWREREGGWPGEGGPEGENEGTSEGTSEGGREGRRVGGQQGDKQSKRRQTGRVRSKLAGRKVGQLEFLGAHVERVLKERQVDGWLHGNKARNVGKREREQRLVFEDRPLKEGNWQNERE
jgi:hypothetical protein